MKPNKISKEYGKEWEIWTLTEADIKALIKTKTGSKAALTNEQLDEIAEDFKNGFNEAVTDWENWLWEAIQLNKDSDKW